MEFNTASLGEQAEQALKSEILSGRLAPEQRIDLGAYAAKWQLSPTPLRDAVKRLEMRGLVEVSPRRGVYVAKIDRTALKEIFELRVALECMAVQLATPGAPASKAAHVLERYRAGAGGDGPEQQAYLATIDGLVHDLVVEHCGNARLVSLMEGLRDLIQWSRWTCYANGIVPYATALPEHLRIAEAIVARNTVEAVEAMRDHLEATFARIDARLGEKDRERGD